MRYGTIVNYFADKKFGFIRPDTGQDIFFHISAIETGDTPLTLQPGQAVKYELMSRAEAAKGHQAGDNKLTADRARSVQPKAKLVALLERLPGGKLAETAGSQMQDRHQRARKKKPTWRR